MKVLILEDEDIAAQSLRRQLTELRPDIRVEAVLQSVEEAADWFGQHGEADLAFFDIHLADGSVFYLFDKVTVRCPIIFTTAYDQYALDAFRVNGIDYLLKPIAMHDLQRALNKYDTLVRRGGEEDGAVLQRLVTMMRQEERQYKSYFLIPAGDKLVPLATQDIACIYLCNKQSIAVTGDGKSHVIDKPLDTIMQDLDPRVFFRANRQYIVSHRAVQDIAFWFGSKLQLRLSVPVPDCIMVSKAKVSEFKDWYTR